MMGLIRGGRKGTSRMKRFKRAFRMAQPFKYLVAFGLGCLLTTAALENRFKIFFREEARIECAEFTKIASEVAAQAQGEAGRVVRAQLAAIEQGVPPETQADRDAANMILQDMMPTVDGHGPGEAWESDGHIDGSPSGDEG